MSAYVVSDYHLNVLVHYASREGCTYRAGGDWHHVRMKEQVVMQMLHNENVRSVNYRYATVDGPGEMTFRPVWRDVSPVQIIKACDCYDYQACETPDYYETPAASLIKQIRKAAIRRLPGYDDAEWSMSAPTHSVETVVLR